MKCPICGKEFSEPVLPLHIERCKNGKEESKETEKTIDKMNKKELLDRAKELEIVIEDEEKITKAQIIELINGKEESKETEK